MPVDYHRHITITFGTVSLDVCYVFRKTFKSLRVKRKLLNTLRTQLSSEEAGGGGEGRSRSGQIGEMKNIEDCAARHSIIRLVT